MTFSESGPVPAQGEIAQQIFWYTAFTADMVKPGLPVVNEDGTPKWRMAPSPHGAYWKEGMKLGYQDAGSWTLLKSTPVDRAQGRLALRPVRHLQDRRREEEPCRPDLHPRERRSATRASPSARPSSAAWSSSTARRPACSGRRPAPTCRTIRSSRSSGGRTIGDAVVGRQDRRRRPWTRSAPSRTRCWQRLERAGVQGDIGPQAQRRAATWSTGSSRPRPNGTLAPQPKIENEKEKPITVNYDELVKSWADANAAGAMPAAERRRVGAPARRKRPRAAKRRERPGHRRRPSAMSISERREQREGSVHVRLRPRDRPGHHLHARHRLRRRLPHRRRRAAGVPAALPAVGLGRARPRGDLAAVARDRPHGARATPRSRPPTSPPSASPTSARRRSSGTATPASRSTTPSSGRTAAPPTSAPSSSRDGARADGHRRRPACSLDPYFSGTKIAWLLDHVDGARAAGRGRRARLRHGRQLPALAADRRRASTPPTPPTPRRTLLFDIRRDDWDDELLRPPRRAARAAARGAGLRRRLRRDRRRRSSAPPIPIRGMAGDQQAATVGQACFAARHDEVDLRHRLLRAAQHRRGRGAPRATGC